MAKKRTWRTAAEIEAELAADPEFQKRQREAEERSRQHAAMCNENARPIMEELWALGFEAESLADFIGTPDPYPEAVPVLVKHFQKSGYVEPVRHLLLSALAIPDAKGFAGPVILKELKAQKDKSSDWTWLLANTLREVATPDMKKEIKAILEDDSYDYAVKHILKHRPRKRRKPEAAFLYKSVRGKSQPPPS